VNAGTPVEIPAAGGDAAGDDAAGLLPTLAQALLARMRDAFDVALVRVAHACAVDGRLDAQRLEAKQWVCYELALASADLLAAETATADLAAASALDAGLALAFATEAIGAVLGRLDGVFPEAGLDPAPLHAIAAGPDLARLRRGATAADVLAALGMAVATANTEISQVALDEHTTMAQETFRASPPRWSRPWPNRSTATTSPCPRRCCSRCARWACSGSRFPRNTAAAHRAGARTR
jgi:hypothetical protein